MYNKRKVRVRFAPSPTGPLHMGGVRTALFNYLFAKKHQGDFILRIEDTDQNRYVQGAEEYIIEALKWCKIEFDESIEKGGNYGPYRQSDRKSLYKQYSDQLVNTGKAYYAFDTPEDLENMRKKLESEKAKVQHYNYVTRVAMKNSFTLTPDEVAHRIKNNEPYVVRFNIPADQNLTIKDIIRCDVTVNTITLDDKVLYKSDGMPTYHLANVVDDYLMQISHVIRGEEWLPSLPLHVLLYKAFGWEDVMPEFAHLPLILKPDGKGKLSKRDGDRLGFPVFPLLWTDPKSGEISSGYRESGYFPEAFVNMLAFLGWNPGTEQEIFSIDQLAQYFSLERVGKSGSKFDPEKTKWFNQQYLRTKTDEELAIFLQSELQKRNITLNTQKIIKIVDLVKERAVFSNDLWDLSSFFFEAPTQYDEKAVKKFWKDEVNQLVANIIPKLEEESFENTLILEENIKAWITTNQIPLGKIMNALRIAVVGTSSGPHLFDIFTILGKNETISRIKKALDLLK